MATPGRYPTFSITTGAVANGAQHFIFWCPGCKRPHAYVITAPFRPDSHVWTFDGNYAAPSLSPSLLIYPAGDQPRCHLFVRGGHIEFCGDSDHPLAGQTVPLPPFSWSIGDAEEAPA